MNIYGGHTSTTKMISRSASAGIVIGVGSVGEFLQPYSQLNTFITRDAGVTWTEIRRGPSLYAFGDHGGLLVLIDDNTPTNKIQYSWNFGVTFKELVISDDPIRATQILTKTGGRGMKFVIYGVQIPQGIFGGRVKPVVVHVDFSNLEQRKCNQSFSLW